MLRILLFLATGLCLCTPAFSQEVEHGGDSSIAIEAPGPSPAGEIQAQPQNPAATAPTEAKDPFDLGVHGTPFHVDALPDPDPQAIEKRKQAAEAAVQKYHEEQRLLQAPSSPQPASN